MEAVEDLLRWFDTRGGQMSRSLELAKGTSYGYYIRIRKDGESIAKGSCIINCPYFLTLSYLNAIGVHPFESHGESLPREFLDDKNIDRHTVTVFFLMLQYLKREQSFWWPYLRTLPQPDEVEKIGTPFWFSEQDRLWLVGTDLEESSLARIDIWRNDWKAAMTILKGLHWPVEAYTW